MDLLRQLRVPDGFEISVFAEVRYARTLALSPSGTVFVGTYPFSGIQGTGSTKTVVYALADKDSDGIAEVRKAVTEPMESPNGVAFLNGNLYVAQMNKVFRYQDVEARLAAGQEIEKEKVLDLPNTHWHGWRYITADTVRQKLLIAIGVPCNVPYNGEVLDCDDNEAHPYFGTVAEFNEDGSGMRVLARGIRNSNGVHVHPETREVWFTDNGRDEWGGPGPTPTEYTNDSPPDEFNFLGLVGTVHEPPNFGFPRCYGKAWVDTASHPASVAAMVGMEQKAPVPFNPARNCDGLRPAIVEMPPHSATLGVRFYNESEFPAQYRGAAFLAEHGSWDRTLPSGYRVSRVHVVPGGQTTALQDFMTGFRFDPPVNCTTDSDCPGNSTCQTRSPAKHFNRQLYCGGRGRPTDVEVLRSGAMLVTDEMNSLVYHIRYTGNQPDCITTFGSAACAAKSPVGFMAAIQTAIKTGANTNTSTRQWLGRFAALSIGMVVIIALVYSLCACNSIRYFVANSRKSCVRSSGGFGFVSIPR